MIWKQILKDRVEGESGNNILDQMQKGIKFSKLAYNELVVKKTHQVCTIIKENGKKN